MKLLVSNGHSYGPGKTHIASKEKDNWGSKTPICYPQGIYAHEKTGTLDDVTCKNCLRTYARNQDRVSP